MFALHKWHTRLRATQKPMLVVFQGGGRGLRVNDTCKTYFPCATAIAVGLWHYEIFSNSLVMLRFFIPVINFFA